MRIIKDDTPIITVNGTAIEQGPIMFSVFDDLGRFMDSFESQNEAEEYIASYNENEGVSK